MLFPTPVGFPTIKRVTEWPGQEVQQGEAKFPTIIWYVQVQVLEPERLGKHTFSKSGTTGLDNQKPLAHKPAT